MKRFSPALSAAIILAVILTGCHGKITPDNALLLGDTYAIYADSVTLNGRCAQAVSSFELKSNFLDPDTDPDHVPDSMQRLLIRRPGPDSLYYESASLLTDAVHNLSLADLDSAFSVHGNTARAAYIVEFALAYIHPERAKELLRSRLDKDGRIRQGFSRGGGWPVATDAIAWASAAWTLFETTGDRDWLREAWNALAVTLPLYEDVAIDPATGLVRGMCSDPGNSSAIPYPEWMTPADVAASSSLSVSTLTAHAFAVAAKMAVELNLDPKPSERRATALREAINVGLWMPNVSRYSQYLYCQPFPIKAGATDNFAQGLAMIYDIPTPEMRDAILERTPVMDLGVPAIYPQMPDTLVNPSNALVPAVEALWAVGASAAGNVTMVYRSLYALLRTCALNLGNYPCVDIGSGRVPYRLRSRSHDPLSAAANLAAIYRGMLGMNFTTYGIEMRPRIATSTPGSKHVANFRYRKALLDINVSGSGSAISSFRIDSIPQSSHVIPANLEGRHTIDIVMAGNMPRVRPVNLTPNAAMPVTPTLTVSADRRMKIGRFVEGDAYEVMLNGVLMQQIFTDSYTAAPPDGLTAICFMPVQEEQFVGYACAPALFWPKGYEITVPADSLAYTGTSLIADRRLARTFVETTESLRRRMRFSVEAPAEGTYYLSVEYANAMSVPWMPSDLCAMRLVSVNDTIMPTPLVMPPTDKEDWTITARSNMVPLRLRRGRNNLAIIYRAPLTLNGHRTLNNALIRRVILLRQ